MLDVTDNALSDPVILPVAVAVEVGLLLCPLICELETSSDFIPFAFKRLDLSLSLSSWRAICLYLFICAVASGILVVAPSAPITPPSPGKPLASTEMLWWVNSFLNISILSSDKIRFSFWLVLFLLSEVSGLGPLLEILDSPPSSRFKPMRPSFSTATKFVRTLESGRGEPLGLVLPACFLEGEMPGDLPLSGGLESPLFSNMARRFLTWLIFVVAAMVAKRDCTLE